MRQKAASGARDYSALRSKARRNSVGTSTARRSSRLIATCTSVPAHIIMCAVCVTPLLGSTPTERLLRRLLTTLSTTDGFMGFVT